MTTANWSEGYATGAGYLHGYFHDLNPRYAAFALLLEGLEGPPPGPCCELGFGQGLSLAMHAAGDPARTWWGNDFMPEHAAQARDLTAAAGVHAEISDQSFEEFFARSDLPQFAFVGLHGVWSWVSPANRARITAFLRRHLLPGGVVYLSYNTLAGWSAVQPLRELMGLHLARAGGLGRPIGPRVQQAMSFVREVLESKPGLLVDTPCLGSQFAQWAEKSPEYLLHEFLNEDWHPLSPAQVAGELADAKLSYACSSDLHNRVTDVHLSAAQQALLAGIDDPLLRESTYDVLSATRFRREYWVRGPRRLARAEAMQRMQAQRLVLAVQPAEVPANASGPQGTRTLPAEHLNLVIGALHEADAPLTVATLMQRATSQGIDPNTLVDTLAALVGSRSVLLATGDAQTKAARPATQRLNAWLTGPHAHRSDILNLASPLSGGGVPAPPLLQMMLGARAAAPKQPDRWPALVWDAMLSEGQQLMKGTQRVSTRGEAETVLQPMVQTLVGQALPLMRRLGVCD